MTHEPWPALVEFLRDIVQQRLEAHFKSVTPFRRFEDDAKWRQLIALAPETGEMTYAERVVLLLALAPHLQPSFFESIIWDHLPNGGDFPEFGGVKGSNHRGLLPTGETAQFVVAGMDVEARLGMQQIFDTHHSLYRHHALWLEDVREGEPPMSGRLILSQDWLDRLLLGRELPPRFSTEFPAKLITTRMTWADLVLHPYTAEQIEDIKRWMQFHEQVECDPNLSRRIQQGYRVLFYGPPGTGKTLTATLLGKEFSRDVYRVDLSQIVSKYIGETEKNLSRIFDRAQNKNWVLFFDEADALFGKRTNVQSSHDRFANQEVSFLLQRVEDFPGLMVLASNYKSNIDDAFLRRFHAIAHFPMPTAAERLRLWEQSMPSSIPRAVDVGLEQLAEEHEISGASILNVVQHATLRAVSRPERTITAEDLLASVFRELRKEERSL
jgi:hypothetical protein